MVYELNICPKCGESLNDEQNFCSKCGEKVGLAVKNGVNTAINQLNTNVNKTTKKVKKSVKIIITITSILILVSIGVFIVPHIFLSVDDLCAQGNYIKAYNKAKDDEKMEVKAESIAAEKSYYLSDDLKEPLSFKLTDVYYNEVTNDDGSMDAQILLCTNSYNNYGEKVDDNWLYLWDDNKEWVYIPSTIDLGGTYNDLEKIAEELEYSLEWSEFIKTIKNDGIKLDKSAIKRINDMLKTDTFNEIEPIKPTE